MLIGITENIAAKPLAAVGAVEDYVCIAIIERVKKWKDEDIGKDTKTNGEIWLSLNVKLNLLLF